MSKYKVVLVDDRFYRESITSYRIHDTDTWEGIAIVRNNKDAYLFVNAANLISELEKLVIHWRNISSYTGDPQYDSGCDSTYGICADSLEELIQEYGNTTSSR
jgi:hypothetical protein